MKIVSLLLLLTLSLVIIEVECIHRHRGKPAQKALLTHQRANRIKEENAAEVEQTPPPEKMLSEPNGPSPSVPQLANATSGPTPIWKTLIKQVSLTPEQRKADADLCVKKDALANMVKQNLKAGFRDLSMTKKVFSVGFSNYIFANFLNVFFKDSFVADAQLIKAAFFPDAALNMEGIKTKLPDFNWDLNDDPLETAKLIVKQYDITEKGSLNFKEFLWFAIKETSPYNRDFKCKNCLENIRPLILDFFEFIDCNSNGYISSEEIFRTLNRMESKKAAESRETNDFVLKADPRKKGFLKKPDFVQAVLRGLWEQFAGDDGVSA